MARGYAAGGVRNRAVLAEATGLLRRLVRLGVGCVLEIAVIVHDVSFRRQQPRHPVPLTLPG